MNATENNVANAPAMLSVGEVLTRDLYSIPDYQRDYDWGQRETEQLVRDIASYAHLHPDKDYYIGTLIVFPKTAPDGATVYETVDGQQRLTTLTILQCILTHRRNPNSEQIPINLRYAFRPAATRSLEAIAKRHPDDIDDKTQKSMLDVYRLLNTRLDELLIEDHVTLEQFEEYLKNHVKILRVALPASTHLNHYFEIMNSRGEQLEKHEVLKAKLMKYLGEDPKAHRAFNLIWEACSDMDGYVQMHFPPRVRQILFGENLDDLKFGVYEFEEYDPEIVQNAYYNELMHKTRDELLEMVAEKGIDPNDEPGKNTIRKLRDLLYDQVYEKEENLQNELEGKTPFEAFSTLLSGDGVVEERFTLGAMIQPNGVATAAQSVISNGNDSDTGNQEDIQEARFTSIIDFPNFLLQVLNVFISDEGGFWISNEDETSEGNTVSLDDKALLTSFEKVLSNRRHATKRDFVEMFIMFLLRSRFIFDKYVIKRDATLSNQQWSLKELWQDNGNKNRNIGYYYTFGKEAEDETDNRGNKVGENVRMLQAAFYTSRPTRSYMYWLQSILLNAADSEWVEKMDQHLYDLARAFMLDWYLVPDEEKALSFNDIIFRNEGKPSEDDSISCGKDLDERLDRGCSVENFIFNFYDFLLWKEKAPGYADFEFSYRTSVEHFYPQHPSLITQQLPEEVLNRFGNLCLIGRGVNSKFTNNMPLAKVENFSNDPSSSLQSLKLRQMMDYTKRAGHWDEEDIAQADLDCKRRLYKALSKSTL